MSPPRCVDAAGPLESTRVAAPVAAAVFAVPFGHAFPLFAVGGNRFALLDRLSLRKRRNAVNDRHDFSRAALRTERSALCWPSRRCSFHFLLVRDWLHIPVLRSNRGIDSRQGAKLAKFGGESLVAERESFTVIFSDLCGLGVPSTLLRTCFAGNHPCLTPPGSSRSTPVRNLST